MFEVLRKPGSFIVKTGAIVGGVYVIRGYMRERLEDVREKLEEERRAKETLRARFSQAHDDVAYTILALLPTLSAQILQDMDVDILTRELQARSKARSAKIATAPSSLASSIVQVSPYPPAPYPSISSTHNDAEADTRSEADSVAHSSEASEIYAPSAYHTANSASFISERGSVTQSWVIDSAAERSRSPARSTFSGGADERLSESVTSTTTNTTSNSDVEGSDTRTKAELWNELKILTFTRTLTTLYASTLLSLLTTLQLTLLARGKYVHSIIHAERQQRLEERMRERMERELSPTNLLVKGVSSWVGSILGRSGGDAMEGLESLLGGLGLDSSFGTEDEDDEDTIRNGDKAEGGTWLGEIDDELENKFLTMSWWLLHVGWKDVGERVRRAAEEVFNGVSLKTKLSAIDLHRLVADIRRRVEHEVTFEGTEKKTNFLSSLLPPTPETIYHVLTQGGYTSASPQVDTNPNLTLNDHDSRTGPQESERAGGTGVSTTSITSSQLSLTFDNSPALAVSARPYHSLAPQAHRAPVAAGASYLAPPPAPHYTALLDASFISLLEETRNILVSADFARVLEVSLDRATEVLFEGLEKNVFYPAGDSTAGQDGEQRIRLAGLLPGLARWSQLAFEGLPNELVDKILDQREVGCLSAIMFAKFEERFQ